MRSSAALILALTPGRIATRSGSCTFGMGVTMLMLYWLKFRIGSFIPGSVGIISLPRYLRKKPELSASDSTLCTTCSRTPDTDYHMPRMFHFPQSYLRKRGRQASFRSGEH